MDTKTTLPISEARKKIFKIAKEVQKPSRYYTLTDKGRPKAVVISTEEFESWQETLGVMRDFPNLERDIEMAKKDYKRGTYSTLEKILAKEGFVLADKSKNKYVSNSSITSRRKGLRKNR